MEASEPEHGTIPFNRPTLVGREFEYIREALESRQLSSGGVFGRRCAEWLESFTGCRHALLTNSCTAALEIAAHLLALEPGDEVIVPSFTFVSTANAFALRGAVPVFVDIRPDTLNVDETRIEEAISPWTKAVVAVHYAGVPAEMDAIVEIARRHRLVAIEDAAQALQSLYRGRAAGNLGDLAAVSFHETKNVISGEGGALLLADGAWLDRAAIARDKGTNRAEFFRGEVDKYTWVDLGSSYGLSELNAAFLWAQLEHADAILRDRLATWQHYHERLERLEQAGLLTRPAVPPHVRHNGHLYYVLVRTPAERALLLEELNRQGVNAVFHYVPLHLSPAGLRFGRAAGDLRHTESVSERLIRLPLWVGMREHHVERVVAAVEAALGARV